VATQTLTPVQDVPDGSGLNITTLLATPTGLTLLFANTGRERLYVAAGAISETVTVDIGALVDGQTVTNFPTASLINGDIYQFGPFHSVLDNTGTNQVQVTLSAITLITVALLQGVGVF
jgi:hypothetical protein